MSQQNNNTINWKMLRSDLDKLEKDCKDKGIPLMHTCRDERSFPKTTTYQQASDTIQLPTGYRWNMAFAKDVQYAVLDIMAK